MTEVSWDPAVSYGFDKFSSSWGVEKDLTVNTFGDTNISLMSCCLILSAVSKSSCNTHIFRQVFQRDPIIPPGVIIYYKLFVNQPFSVPW